ncbi:Ohr subfamily peroxiredoxin [Filimonas zeae]|uniref:Organic hydroperoxide resistance protein n=1 Tax=Filimonas zeae TaxID=1737353 RepID=A0A917MTA0_9BACT|nr:organic hydroperoxide resistance protein [Filimonas zeae]MDR6338331.1 Ohr subfamily peroxiredoxin [Filimonas zeae]GGH62881.1 organic hydroperoxide resistance protein [Filimonas zeae]
MKTLYQTSATVTGGRNGKVTSEDGALELEVRMPKELGGSGAGYTNPEQLFAAGYASCFDSALNLVMQQAKVKPESPSSVKASVALGPNEQGGFVLGVTLAVTIPGIERQQAQELVEKAHQVCPYSNATRGNIDVQLQVV